MNFRNTDRHLEMYRDRPALAECCVEEREAWRREARTQGLLPFRSGDTIPKSRVTSLSRLRSLLSAGARRAIVMKTPLRPDGSVPVKIGFYDLPPELRELTYKEYIKAWGTQRLTPFRLPRPNGEPYPSSFYYKPIPPHEPPLMRTSRLIRKESLSVFYACYRFPIIAHPNRGAGPSSMTSWFPRLDAEKLALIRHLEIHLCYESDHKQLGFRQPHSIIYHVDFDEKANRAVTYVHRKEGSMLGSPEWKLMLSYIRKRVDCLVAQPGIGRFTADDVDAIVGESLTELRDGIGQEPALLLDPS